VTNYTKRLRASLDFGFQSTISQKIVMAVSGVILIGFVVTHMIGNLKIYQGPEKLNAYGHFLRDFGYPMFSHGQILWILRLGLLAALGAHLSSAISLTRRNRNARPVAYKKSSPDASSYASRTMIWGGVILFLFVIFHILHLTTGHAHSGFEPGNVYANVILGFQQWPIALIYMIAQVALGLHLHHGLWSMTRTLGAGNQKREPLRRLLSTGIALLVVLGNISIPVSVLAGWIH
jgi:succinate dehydrogenase / fumarate reductase cytochrome b subunit